MLAAEKELLSASILELVQQTARRRFTIATGTSRFLIIRFERARHLIVNHETNIRFVDAHAKRIRRYDRFQFIIHERILIAFAIACFHASVILLDLVVEPFQPIRQSLNHFDSRGVDDPDTLVFVQYPNELFMLLTLVGNSLDL